MIKTKILNSLVRMVCEKEGGKKKLDAPQAREFFKIIAGFYVSDNGEAQQFVTNLAAYISLHEKKAKKKK